MADASAPKPIKTKRLTLREARISDLDAIHELYSNEDVMRYWSTPFDIVSQTREYLETMITSPNNGTLAFVIVLPPSASKTTPSPPFTTATDEGKIIGHAGMWLHGTNELVFMIGKPHWNQGFMTEVIETLISIFWQKGVKMVSADVDSENEASLKLLRNFGFRQIGGNVVESDKWRSESLRMELMIRMEVKKEEEMLGDELGRSSEDTVRG